MNPSPTRPVPGDATAASATARTARAMGWLALAMLPLDALWLGLAIPRLYQPALGPLLAERPDWLAGVLFYGLYALGVAVLVLRSGEPGATPSPAQAGRRGALFGLVAYATYDLTNQATLRGWPWHLTAIDLVWGSLLTGLVSAFAAWRLGRRR